MRQFVAVVLGMLGALVGWQAVMAFLGLGIFVSGFYAGCSLAAFSATLFIFGSLLIKPKEN